MICLIPASLRYRTALSPYDLSDYFYKIETAYVGDDAKCAGADKMLRALDQSKIPLINELSEIVFKNKNVLQAIKSALKKAYDGLEPLIPKGEDKATAYKNIKRAVFVFLKTNEAERNVYNDLLVEFLDYLLARELFLDIMEKNCKPKFPRPAVPEPGDVPDKPRVTLKDSFYDGVIGALEAQGGAYAAAIILILGGFYVYRATGNLPAAFAGIIMRVLYPEKEIIIANKSYFYEKNVFAFAEHENGQMISAPVNLYKGPDNERVLVRDKTFGAGSLNMPVYKDKSKNARFDVKIKT